MQPWRGELKVGAHPVPHEKYICISLVDGLHICMVRKSILGDIFIGRVKSLIQIQLLSFNAFVAVFHDMGSSIVSVVVGSAVFNLQNRASLIM